MDSLKLYILIIVFFPFFGSLIVGLSSRILSNQLAHWLTTFTVFISSVFSFKLFYGYTFLDYQIFEYTFYNWGIISDLKLEVGFLIDRLTSIMLFIVCTVSFLVHVYTIGYMKGDNGYNRFFSYISFFTFSMLMLVSSNNFLQLFFGWEAVGLASYLLIGFWFKKESAIFANLKAFIVNRIGDLGFILGIAGIFCCFGSLNYLEVFNSIRTLTDDNFLLYTVITFDYTSAITFISICLFIGAMGKSAQIPLHVWLPDSMEGPTPISALIHAATMVTAGIFMVSRMSPIFEYSQSALIFMMLIGVATCFFMGILGIVQNDIKRIIAYSTLSQLGLMVVGLGVSAYSASIFHLFTHAFFKALLFLGAGSVIISLHHEQDIRNMGTLKKYMPITYYTMLIGSLALSGFPGFSGFFSKDLIIDCVKLSSLPYSNFVYYILIISIAITSFYTFRLFFLVFHTNDRLDHDIKHHIKESSYVITIPLCILAIFSIFSGWLFFDFILNNYFFDSIYIKDSDRFHNLLLHELSNSFHLFLHGLFSIPFLMTLLGFFGSWYIYCKNINVAKNISNKFSFLYMILLNKYGFDDFNQYIIANGIRSIGNIFWKFGDMFLVDKLFVNGIANVIKYFSLFFSKIQSGRLYNYVYIMVTGFTILLCWIVLKFA